MFRKFIIPLLIVFTLVGCNEEEVSLAELTLHYKEKVIDSNGNGVPDEGERFYDQNENGKWDNIENFRFYRKNANGTFKDVENNEVLAFTGQAVSRYDGGQMRYLRDFKNGLLDGNSKKWTPLGIIAYEYKYQNGLLQGSQKVWSTTPINKKHEDSEGGGHGEEAEDGEHHEEKAETWVGLQVEAREKAKQGDFPSHPSQESNDWVHFQFNHFLHGKFMMKTLRHYENGKPHGEWEEWEENKAGIKIQMFESTYEHGKLIEHKLMQ